MKKQTKRLFFVFLSSILAGVLVFFIFVFPKMKTSVIIPSVCFGYDLESVPMQYQEHGLILGYDIDEETDTVQIQMTIEQQRYLLEEVKKASHELLEQIPYESAENNFLSIKTNHDFTRFYINMMDENYTTEDTSILSTLVSLQVLYNSLAGSEKTDIVIHFRSEETGEEFGVFDVSHLATGEMTEFETAFYEKFYGASISTTIENAVQDQINLSGMLNE